MIHVIDIALKDLMQLLRERETFLFLLILPVIFTLLFGFAFGGFGGGESDPRLPVGYLDQDDSPLSRELHGLLDASEVIRLDEDDTRAPTDLEKLVADEKLAAAIVVPAGYGEATLAGAPTRLILFADTASPAGRSVQNEALTAVNRLASAVRTANIVTQVAGDRAAFDSALQKTIAAWERPPIAVAETTSTAIEQKSNSALSLAHTSPGMMVQFAIAGLLTAAQIIVAERKSRALQRLLTTATARAHILLGHYLAMLALILGQFVILIAFGQIVLKVDYLREPGATTLMAVTTAMCVAALGLLIGTLARSEEQAIIFSLVPMFVLAALGGAWVPLEVTGAAFQAIGHVSPVAWAMDGFKNVVSRGLGLESVLLPALALLGYAVLFFAVAVWRFHSSEEQ
ncbi:MAG TPA: ABC transporter permease [Anaerolineae bacterium]|nr:ABC transporter permease [Anaerolineae bacterium]